MRIEFAKDSFMIKENPKKSRTAWDHVITIVPTTFAWILIALFVLIYVFDLISYIEQNNLVLIETNFILDNDFILMAIWAIPTGITVSLTGTFIDRYPQTLRYLITVSMVWCSISLLIDMISLVVRNPFLMAFSLANLGFFTGSLIVSSQTFYASMTKWTNRSKTYSIAIFIFGISTLSLLIITAYIHADFFFPLGLISIFGILFGFIFHFTTKSISFQWTDPSDEYPTKLFQILTRTSVITYFWTHTLLWMMLGLMFGSLAQIGAEYGFTKFFGIEIGSYKTFWSLVLSGSFISVLIAGFLSDKWGRKTSIILATYGIVLASLVIGLLEPHSAFPISAIIIGLSFALVHTSLDSSLWIDLASNDSLGRYQSLNFQSLGLGFIIGFVISYWIYLRFLSILGLAVFILIGIAVLANLPLFWISDSFPPLEFFLLLVINEAGIPIFHYSFGEKRLKVDLPLIAGALSAVGSFMVEATGEKDAQLNLVRHGTHFILSDQTETGISAAIFSNKNDLELQKLMTRFLKKFQQEFRDVLDSWDGNLKVFEKARQDAEEIFGPLVAMKN